MRAAAPSPPCWGIKRHLSKFQGWSSPLTVELKRECKGPLLSPTLSSQRRSSWTPGRGRTCPESLCVWQSWSQDPGVQSPSWLSVHDPTLLVISVAAYPPGWDSAPSTLVLHKPAPSPQGGHSLLLSQFPHLLDGGGVPETSGPSQPPSSWGPWTCPS